MLFPLQNTGALNSVFPIDLLSTQHLLLHATFHCGEEELEVMCMATWGYGSALPTRFMLITRRISRT